MIHVDPRGVRLEHAGTQIVMAVGEKRTVGPYEVEVVKDADGSLGVQVG